MMTTRPQPLATLTVNDVMAELGLCHDTVCKLLKAGDIPGRKFGNVWRISRTEFDRYLDRLSQTGPKEPAKSPVSLVTRKSSAA